MTILPGQKLIFRSAGDNLRILADVWGNHRRAFLFILSDMKPASNAVLAFRMTFKYPAVAMAVVQAIFLE